MKITQITARSMLDSRGLPTVEATVVTEKGAGTAAVPAGTSTGRYEAKELRDGDQRWGGLGVTKAVSHVNVELASALKGRSVADQAELDHLLIETDGSEDKSRLGANALLAVSLAALKAAAAGQDRPLWRHVAELAGRPDPAELPVPLCNLVNGGAHADNPISIQEFMLVPHGFERFTEALRAVAETFQALGRLLKGRDLGTAVGLEGGYAPRLETSQATLDLLVEAITAAGYQPGEQLSIALDVAAAELLKDDHYLLDGNPLTADQLVAEYAGLLESYPLVSIEDPLGEDDWDGWERMAARLGSQVQIVADDLTVTKAERITEAADRADIAAVILKPNQIGTYSETWAAYQAADQAGVRTILSHRSGDTADDAIADLAVGWGAPMLKAGSTSRGERVAKYNRILAIEQTLGGRAVYAGPALAKRWGKPTKGKRG